MKYIVIKEIEMSEFDNQLEALQVMASLRDLNQEPKTRYSIRVQ